MTEPSAPVASVPPVAVPPVVAALTVTPIAPPPLAAAPASPGVVARLGRLFELAFGTASLVVILAFVAAVPVLQLLTLGFLLDAEGRIARTGKLRGSMPWLPAFARSGGALAGILITFLPWLIVRDFAHDAALIDPTSDITRKLRAWTLAVFGLGLVHAGFAVLRGARFRDFVNPLGAVLYLVRGAPPGGRSVRELLATLEVGRTFLLGLKGAAAALAWIAVPTALLALGQKAPGVGVIGGFALAVAVVPLPLLQAHVAAEGRFLAGFELRAAAARFRGAPLAALVALVLALGLALPLYFLKLELIPRDARVLAAIVFIVTILPTKLAAGWAYARGKGRHAHLAWRAGSVVLALAAAGVYALVLFFTGLVEWRGAAGLFEQHAFLVPVAFY